MAQSDRIPIPLSHRWRWIRIQAVPLIVFAICAFVATQLWKSQGGTAHAVGEVLAVRVDLISQLDGVLADVPYRRLQVFDRVQAGDVVLRLDDQATRAALETLGKSLEQAKAELDKTAEQARVDDASRRVDELSEVRRRALRIEELRLAILQTKTLLETDRVELQRLNELLDVTKDVYERKAGNRVDLINAQLRRDIVAQRIASNEKVLGESESQRDRATSQMSEFSPQQAIEVAKLLAPVRAAIGVQEARIRELELQVKALEIRAPLDGTVAAVARWPGQAVRAGDAVVTIASEQAEYIVSYVRQQSRFRPAVGMAVDARLRGSSSVSIEGYVDRVGPQIELVPPHQLRDPRVAEWGLPVRVMFSGQGELKPGELVDLKFRPSKNIQLPVDANPAAPQAEPGA
jgi:multidrug resistance efflux pump